MQLALLLAGAAARTYQQLPAGVTSDLAGTSAALITAVPCCQLVGQVVSQALHLPSVYGAGASAE
jgi:hypothetical protein